jgi:uncharacterized protein YjbJ (UPF0337 family)
MTPIVRLRPEVEGNQREGSHQFWRIRSGGSCKPYHRRAQQKGAHTLDQRAYVLSGTQSAPYVCVWRRTTRRTNQGERVMNTDIVQGKWHQLKGSVKAQWGKLTDDELDQVDGNAEKLVGLVQERYGYARQRAEQEVDSFFARQKV